MKYLAALILLLLPALAFGQSSSNGIITFQASQATFNNLVANSGNAYKLNNIPIIGTPTAGQSLCYQNTPAPTGEYIPCTPANSTNIDPTTFGAAFNALTVNTGSISAVSNPTTLTIGSSLFTAAMVGESISVNGAGSAGGPLDTTIQAYISGTQVTLASPALTTVASAGLVRWGTDDTVKDNLALAAAVDGKLVLPAGQLSYISGQLIVPSGVVIDCQGGGFVAPWNTVNTDGMLLIQSDSYVHITNCRGIDGGYTGGTGQPSNPDIAISDSQHIQIDYSTIYPATFDGILVDNQSQDVILDHDTYDWSRLNFASGVTDGVHVGDNNGATPINGVWITDSTFLGAFDEPVGLTNSTTSADDYSVEGLHILNNHMYVTSNACVDVAGVFDVWVMNNDCSGFDGNGGIQIHNWPSGATENDAYDIHVSHNHLFSPGSSDYAGIDETEDGSAAFIPNANHQNASIELDHNIIEIGAHVGIALHAYNSLVHDNTINGTSYGIDLSSSTTGNPVSNQFIYNNALIGNSVGVRTNSNAFLGTLKIRDNHYQGVTTRIDDAVLTGETVEDYASTDTQLDFYGTLLSAHAGIVIPLATDEALNLSNGGHLNSIIGGGTAPTSGTGTATGTDNAFTVTGGTSPVTVTFGTAFHATPDCVCDDKTAALGSCKAVPSSGSAVVVTTTGTDTFSAICIGH